MVTAAPEKVSSSLLQEIIKGQWAVQKVVQPPLKAKTLMHGRGPPPLSEGNL